MKRKCIREPDQTIALLLRMLRKASNALHYGDAVDRARVDAEIMKCIAEHEPHGE